MKKKVLIKNREANHLGYIFLFLVFNLLSIFGQGQISIQLITNPEVECFGCLEWSNVPFLEKEVENSLNQQDWKAIFPVQFGEKLDPTLPSMLGKYEVKNQSVFFQPRFPFTQGKAYTAAFQSEVFSEKMGIDCSEKTIIQSFEIPNSQPVIPTFLEQIYPTDSLLPMNLLKIYLYFSAPMRSGQAFEHLKLLNEKGEVVADPFLYLDKELWDKEGKRLTIWFDPGRIKRDLTPNEMFGLPLQTGQSYQLVADKNWQDIRGNSLKENFVKSFSVVENDRQQPKTTDWTIDFPKSGTPTALKIRFGEAMDYALLQNSLAIFNKKNEIVAGEVKIKNGEKEWWFLPKENWQAGTYTLRVAAVLEDLAGNNLNRLFDRDIHKDAEAVLNRDYVDLDFLIE